MNTRAKILTLTAIAGLTQGASIRAEIPSKLEPMYAEAVIAFNGKDYGRALKLLDQVLSQAPATTEALELKALSLKATHKDAKAEKTYLELIKEKEKDHGPNAESAPYHFEIGVIRYREKDHQGARHHLEIALAQDFNRGACHFFMGMMDHEEKRDEDAERHFRAVESSKAEDLKPPARFFLAQTFLREGYYPGATQAFFSALDEGRADLDNPLTNPETKDAAKEIVAASEKALHPFDKSGLTGDVGLLLGYDSNVLTEPITAFAQGTGRSAAKLLVNAGVGYATSPVSNWQLVPSYRFSLIKTNHPETQIGEFITNVFSLYLNHKPLAPTAWGIKTDFIWLFRNQFNPANLKTFDYGQYSRTLSIGPYFRKTLRPRLTLGGELDAQLINNVTDNNPDEPTPENLKKSGYGLSARVFLQQDATHGWLNPTLTLGYDYNHTTGVDFRSKGPDISLTDTAYVTKSWELIPMIDLALPSYSDRTPARSDKTLNVALSSIYHFTHHWNGILDLRYTKNYSGPDQATTDAFAYNRSQASFGVSYVF